jgi:organic radical activating enzyme
MKIPGKEKLLKESKAFCMLPWMHLFVNTDSSVWSCCVNKAMTNESLHLHESHTETNIMTQSIQQVINTDYFKQLRLDMLNGVQNENCSGCYALEESSGHSYRNDFNNEYDKYFDKVLETNEDGSIDNFETVYLDFRFSNLCNFKCRSCRPEWSSTWAKEARDNLDHPYNDWGGAHKKDNFKRYNQTKDDFIFKFAKVFNTVKRIYFAGGEPLAAKEQYWMLEYLIDNGRTDVVIEYNTNLSMLKNNNLKLNIIDYWKHFKNINLRVSLDAMGKRAEYLRHGTDWKVIEDNFKYVKENLPNANVGISSVFQLANATHLPDFYQNWIDKGLIDHQGLTNTFIIPLTGPPQLSSQVLPKSLKIEVEHKWDTFSSKNLTSDHNNTFLRYMEDCIGYMNGEDLYESNKEDFINWTAYLDKIRNENFIKTFPELEESFGYEKVFQTI